ncbi:serine hydrolase domain-containing protein [candidate division KSB1 bacterium]
MNIFPYEDPATPEKVDIDRNKLEKVVSRFKDQQAAGLFPGGQLVLRRYGKVVTNETCGMSRGMRSGEPVEPVAVQPFTPFPVLSSGKPIAAVVIAILEDRKLFDVKAPIAKLIPEFSLHGKENITTLDVLTHRAGIILPELANDPTLWGNREAVLKHLIEARPAYKRGTFAYMPWEYGLILSEICRRIDGRTLPDFAAEEISAPLRLPSLKYGLAGRNLDSLAFTYWLGKKKHMIAGMNVAEKFEAVNNSVEFFNAANPAVSLVTDAASLAAFYEFLVNKGVTNSGQRLISEEIIQKYTTQGLFGWDKSNRTFLTLGRGFMLGSRSPSPFGWWNTQKCFGHGGGFSSLAFGDFETGISAVIVTNGNRGPLDYAKRFIALAQGLRKACC